MANRETMIHDAFAAMGLGSEKERARLRQLADLGRSPITRSGFFVRITAATDIEPADAPLTEASGDAELA